eukprot:12877788-Alexandrium_andersonii.AAC.1
MSASLVGSEMCIRDRHCHKSVAWSSTEPERSEGLQRPDYSWRRSGGCCFVCVRVRVRMRMRAQE